jgi:hypothetical protein
MSLAMVTRGDELAGECRTFTSYLLGRHAAPDVVAAYQKAHEVSVVDASGVTPSLDLALLRVARFGSGGLRAADAYAAVLAPSSLLRRKLTLLVAILESRGQSAAALDTAGSGSRAGWIFDVSARAGASALMLCVGAMLVTPLRAWYRLASGRTA